MFVKNVKPNTNFQLDRVKMNKQKQIDIVVQEWISKCSINLYEFYCRNSNAEFISNFGHFNNFDAVQTHYSCMLNAEFIKNINKINHET